MAVEVLLIEDVLDLGRAGEVHRVKPGFARNFLLPKQLALVADKNTLRKQERLKAERAAKAERDLAEAQAIAAKLEGLELTTIVKVDPQGHMYGSVHAADVVKLFEAQGHQLDRHVVHLVHGIKQTGTHNLTLRFKEGVTCSCKLHILTEGQAAEQAAQG